MTGSPLKISAHLLLDQMENAITELQDSHYTQPLPVLSGATIGQHTRHILEFFIELDKGYHDLRLCYDNRKRDVLIESDKKFALRALASIRRQVGRPDRGLKLVHMAPEQIIIDTTFYRELIYIIEHTIHHMALLRIGIQSVSTLLLPEEFGTAPSTIRYRQQCAQ